MTTEPVGTGTELYDVISAIYEANRTKPSISPAWLATEGMVKIVFPRKLHPLGYTGCHLQLRQIARSFCRRVFDPTDDAAMQNDLFPETLQERYPTRGNAGEEPKYVLLDNLADADVDFNVVRMRRASRALQKHADALDAWKLARADAQRATAIAS